MHGSKKSIGRLYILRAPLILLSLSMDGGYNDPTAVRPQLKVHVPMAWRGPSPSSRARRTP